MKMSVILFCLFCSVSSFAKVNLDDSILGEYARESTIRFTPESAESCEADNGYIHADGSCTQVDEQGNSLTLFKNNLGQVVVKISVVYGSYVTSDFAGVVTKTNSTVLVVSEAEVSDDSQNVSPLTKDGCTLELRIARNTANVTLGKTCDQDLYRIDGAQKQWIK